MTTTTAAPTRHLQIDFLFLDLDTCTRCRATDATLVEAIQRTRPALDAAGVGVTVNRTLVADAAHARELDFVSSPTIRIDGRDIAGNLLESPCDTCSETCACDGGVDCRDWLWRGQRSTEPPVGLLVEAIMRHVVDADPIGASPVAPAPLPENLRHYFASTMAETSASGCCTLEAQSTCCDTEHKAECCGSGVAQSSCGCQA